ncbi:MAG: T9SS type A sorting domain-containing protein [Ignavibacteriaceae bacterium]
MKKIYTILPLLLLLLLTSQTAAQTSDDNGGVVIPKRAEFIFPPEYASTVGTAVFTGPLASTARTIQLLISENLLTPYIGKEIKGFTWRLGPAATANWPATDQTFLNYDVYLSGSVAPADRSLTFANNIVGTQTLVRTGSLVIAAGVFTYGMTPNKFGQVVNFTTGYLYTGGNLLIEIRHSGTANLSTSTDAVGTAITGYGTLFSACWASGAAALTGSQGNFLITQINIEEPIPVELTSFTAGVNGSDVTLSWTTATETNNLGFEIERRDENSLFKKIGFISGAGTTAEECAYSYEDNLTESGKYYYRLKQLDFDGGFEYSNEIEVLNDKPATLNLSQNYPNPFNPSTVIRYEIPESGNVTLKLYDISGMEIATLVNQEKEPGAYEYTLSASVLKLSSGVYFYKLQSNGFTSIKKLVLMK